MDLGGMKKHRGHSDDGGLVSSPYYNYMTTRQDYLFVTVYVGATALILIGTCTVFLVLICFFFFIQKIRQQRIQRKVVEKEGGDVVKPQITYEGPHSPLSLLPPALIQALALASQSSHKEEDIPPTFLTMEPPFSNNSLGRLWFSVYYDYLTSNLVLKVLHARYPKGRGWSSNPGEVWVEAVVLSPLNSVMATANTGTRRASSAPVFQQTFRFKVDDMEVTQYLLRLTLYDRSPDQPGEKASGAVIVPLSSLDLCSQETLARDLQ
ncbi:hypothetical protein Pcinc_040967 [Petrolisthes cinctipes]|uniref:C2 domain-containing protein n=1 Tax=Petrolisthes cinctipes TaxID=88211 RepID=A0AAE1EI84_PETCI|nr:hypothetical protein Pcinc_040967 [Petrolisthes cinctipes]